MFLPPGTHKAHGGVIHGATGFLTRGPVFQVGENGQELVDPLEGDRAERLRAQSIAHALKLLGVTGAVGDRQTQVNVHVDVAFGESGRAFVRSVRAGRGQPPGVVPIAGAAEVGLGFAQ